MTVRQMAEIVYEVWRCNSDRSEARLRELATLYAAVYYPIDPDTVLAATLKIIPPWQKAENCCPPDSQR